MSEKNKEKSIIGKFDAVTRRLVILLVIPIIISFVMMLFFMDRYHSSIVRIETISSLKNVVAEEIPELTWNVVSGRDSFVGSGVYPRIRSVYDTIADVSSKTSEENRLSLIVAERTMQTLEGYVKQIRDNIEAQVPVVENETVMEEIRSVADLVASMLNEYITGEIDTIARMSVTLRIIIIIIATVEGGIVLLAGILRIRSMKKTSVFVRQPIERLENVAEQLADGTLDARITETEVTELRNLTRQVNIMADRLEDMMKKSLQDERNLRKAELRNLQAQINPHFLYNTLDAIIWKAEAGEKNEVIQLTSALSDFFRISLSSGADWIPVSQERKHIEGYLTIQQTRYRDIMHYEIDIPEELGRFYILKLLIQPLVENALYHGIKIKRGGGTIKVTGRLEDDMLVFTVKDTGLGMTEEQMNTLKERMKNGQPTVSEGTGGFGLVNVNLRIRLYYSQEEGLKIKSGPEGTEVSFRVPCRTKEEISENESISG